MKSLDVPFNIDLLQLKPETLKLLKPVTSLDVFQSSSKSFHPDGLYSTTIFGTVGTDARYTKYSYIDLKIDIIHPIIFKALLQMKVFYKDIMSGREFATWDDELKDFVKSNALDGQTGFQFFITHWKDIVFQERPSTQREQNIKMIDKYKDKAMTSKVFVLPAGYRDLEVDDNGRESSDEINSLYYKLIAISNTINPATVEVSPQAYNSQRMSLQNTFVQIYDSFLKIVEGKKNLLMGKWASRKIFNGTRNVITSMDTTIPVLGAPGNIGMNDTLVGIYQCMKAMLPIARHKLKVDFLSEVFTSVSAPALLTNAKTLQSERVYLNSDDYDQWMTNEGLDSLISSYSEPSIRDNPININGYYLGLIYRGPDSTFRLIHGIDELPEKRNKEDCTPVTLTELFYIAIYNEIHKVYSFVTRYPIQSSRSVYPSKVRLQSTIGSEYRIRLDSDWKQIPGDENIAYRFPIKGHSTYDSLSPNSVRLEKLTADFDGDNNLPMIISLK